MGFFDDVARIIAAPVTVPIRVVANVVSGHPPLPPILDLARDMSGVLQTASEIATFPQTILINLGKDAFGDAGKVVAEIATATNRYSIETVVQSASAFKGILEGKNPLEVVAIPLASAITAAAREYRAHAMPLPHSIRRAFAKYYSSAVLDRTRYVVGSVGINLPDVINTSKRFFAGEDQYAVTVDDVIVFSQLPPDIPSGVEWWAHEIQHVAQYTEWGVNSFAYRYITDWNSVETEARNKGALVASDPDIRNQSFAPDERTTAAAVYTNQYHVCYTDRTGTVCDCFWNTSSSFFSQQIAGTSTSLANVNPARGNPAVAVYVDQFHVCYTDSSDRVWDCFYGGGKWYSQWVAGGPGSLSNANPAGSDPSVAVYSGQLHVCYVDNDGVVWDCFYGAGKWFAQRVAGAPGSLTIPNPARGTPSVTAYGAQYHVCYADKGGTVWDCFYGGGWFAQRVAGAPGSLTIPNPARGNPSVAVYVDQYHVCYADNTGTVWDCFYGAGKWYSQRVAGGSGSLTEGPLAEGDPRSSVFNNQYHVCYRDRAGKLWDCVYDPSGKWSARPIG